MTRTLQTAKAHCTSQCSKTVTLPSCKALIDFVHEKWAITITEKDIVSELKTPLRLQKQCTVEAVFFQYATPWSIEMSCAFLLEEKNFIVPGVSGLALISMLQCPLPKDTWILGIEDAYRYQTTNAKRVIPSVFQKNSQTVECTKYRGQEIPDVGNVDLDKNFTFFGIMFS